MNLLRILLTCIATVTCAPNVWPGETLYNGIELPKRWPPTSDLIPRSVELAPYLQRPPEVIPIDVGRQLFVDDFLIESTNLQREFHQPALFEGNPILRPRIQSIEIDGNGFSNAAPFSDGVWWDPADKKFKMWYLARRGYYTCYATSEDGIHWNRANVPAQDPEAEPTNVVLDQRGDSSTVWLDLEAQDPARRFAMLTWRGNQIHFRSSADGTSWNDPIWSSTRAMGDRSTFFYNPFRKVWVYSMRKSDRYFGRVRHYLETSDMHEPSDFAYSVPWIRADDLDRVQPVISNGKYPDLYNLDATPYESLMLGLFNIQSVEHNQYPNDLSHPKVVHVSLGYSRDGFHWARPDRRPFLDIAKESASNKTVWNRGNVQSVGGGCLVVGDRLLFYFSGRVNDREQDDGSGMSTGIAFLRRDGFASMNAGEKAATLTTRVLRFSGREMFVNIDNTQGALRVEVLDEAGKPHPGFAVTDCEPVRVDSTKVNVKWKRDLETLAGKQVRFRFHLKSGKLYSFWVSQDERGASLGYVAAGGPEFHSNRDN